MLRSFAGVMAGLLICSAAFGQAQLYRYVDDKGVTVLGNRVPPEFVSRGYEVLDSNGRVREVIPAAPTAEELKANRAAREAQDRQRQSDTTLLRLYSSQADLDRAHARQLAQIESLIQAARSEIDGVQDQREGLQERAAVQERAGREIDPQILQDLAHADAETQRLERLIEAKQAEIKEVRANFVHQRARLGYLLGASDSGT
ncbi:MAG: DUF4124 domain-containing protein [Pseudoalteromonas distincta]|tara:strand:+ start:1673 stop:2278 length:606 start_codon:yes stop_codon:yes gene_type:complete